MLKFYHCDYPGDWSWGQWGLFLVLVVALDLVTSINEYEYINNYVQYEYTIILSNFRTTKGGQSILLTRLLFPSNEWVDRHTQAPQNTYTSL